MKGKHFDLPHIFGNRSESFTSFSETRLHDKEPLRPRLYREQRYHSEKETHAAPSVTIKEKHVNNENP